MAASYSCAVGISHKERGMSFWGAGWDPQFGHRLDVGGMDGAAVGESCVAVLGSASTAALGLLLLVVVEENVLE